ncbi:hypothetical protein [Desulfovibrio ferrophilus]|nr:hypothetical protein [Desulfovibrio ferrophilus]
MTNFTDMSAVGGVSAASTFSMAADKETFGAQVVTKTLDYMNSSPSSGSTSANYDFQKSVLSAVYTGTGTLLDSVG